MDVIPLPIAKTRHVTKYLPVAELLRQRILDGTYTGRLPTYPELTRELSISSVTLQKAIDCLSEAGLVQGQRNRGVVITRLRRPRTRRIGVLVPGLSGQLTNRFLHSAWVAANRHGHGLSVECFGQQSDVLTATAQRLFDGMQVDGLIVLWASGTRNIGPLLAYLSANRVPCTLVGEPDPTLAAGINQVTVSDLTSLVLDHLLEHGHRRIAFADFSPDFESPLTVHRWRAYQAGLALAGLPCPPPVLIADDEAVNPQIAERLRTCDAVLAATDATAMRIMRHALDAGLRIPHELSICGCDDHPSAKWLGLTSVDLGLDQAGGIAVDLLIDEIEARSQAPKQVVIAGKLVPRTSVGNRLP